MKIPDKFPADSKPKRPLRSGLSGRGIGFQPMILSSTKRGMGFQPMIPKSIAGMIRQAALPGLALLALATAAVAGDILRGGATADPSRRNAAARANAGAEAAASAKRTAEDRLARTTKVIESLRSPNVTSGSSSIPSGLVPGGLVIANPSAWVGAQLPTQNGSTINIVQTASTAQLFWESFNIARGITLNFDQSAGGTDIGKWIAFNQVVGNSETRIGGILRGGGQVYVNNPNGIRFESGSQVTARTFVASTLPINSNLVKNGLVNLSSGNPEFLFTTTGQNGFVPPAPPASGRFGDVYVAAGALIQSTVSQDGGGGRITLVGANVTNDGELRSSSGQIILAAGLQVGLSVHSKSFPQIPDRILDARTGDDDPSLRGLDAYVGSVGTYAGTAVNNGLISVPQGSLQVVGKRIIMNGAIDSLTSTTLNGRVDLLANFAAIPSSNYNGQASSIPFLNTQSGEVILGRSSVLRILPDYASTSTTVSPFGLLPLKSQINIQGRDVYLGQDSIILAPNADLAIAAGSWRSVPANGVRLAPDFIFTNGQVFIDRGAIVDVSGSSNVFSPLANSILEVQLRGNELSVAPLQRTSDLRGVTLTIDIRRSGNFYGRDWVGTPLGDASGFQDVVQKTVGQLTANAGTALIRAGAGIVTQPGSVIDVSGGYYVNEGGRVQTTRLLYQGRYLIDVADATPDRLYDGIYDGKTSKVHQKWGISKTFSNPLAPLGSYYQKEYIQGADGGSLSLTAPGLALDGEMAGNVVIGPRQMRDSRVSSELPSYASLNLSFTSQAEITPPNSSLAEIFTSAPTPPTITFGGRSRGAGSSQYIPENSNPISSSRLANFDISENFYTETGFGNLRIDNSEGLFNLVAGFTARLPANGQLVIETRNASLLGSIVAPGGLIDITAYNFPRYSTLIAIAEGTIPDASLVDPAQGNIRLSNRTTLDVSGSIVDDRPTAPRLANPMPVVIEGGEISLVAYSVNAPSGSVLNASGGLAVSADGKKYVYGDGGSITVEAGQDPEYGSVLGGKLRLESTLLGYSGAVGATLSLKAPLIQIGGSPLHSDTLLLTPAFFNQGGFSRFNLTGIGGAIAGSPVANPADPDAPLPYLPAVYVAPGTVIEPRVESVVYAPFPGRGSQAGLRRYVKPLGSRNPVSLGFYAEDTRNDFEILALGALGDPGDILLRRGDIRFGEGTRIAVEPGGEIVADGSNVEVLGSLIAPGGNIEIAGSNSFPLSASDQTLFLRPTVFIGPRALISTRGVAVYESDPFKRLVGRLFPGGTISVSGNIVASAGALLDVSGGNGLFDIHPSRLSQAQETKVPQNSGINSLPFALRSIRMRVDSDGGTLTLTGGQMLFSDATLRGFSGGPTALGGTLSVSSGRGYTSEPNQLGSDINLVVTQSRLTIPGATPSGVGRPVRDGGGAIIAPMGYFAADRFLAGGFDSLELGVSSGAATQARGGNVEFRGPVNIQARGSIKVATGGVIRADSIVNLEAQYIAVGQAFQAPFNPTDEITNPYIPFVQSLAGLQTPESVTPEFGTGVLNLTARLIDVGTLILKGVGKANFHAPGGDIRGNGVLNIQGDITLRAAQIYPTTLSDFAVFAYDPAGGTGSIRIQRDGTSQAPLSAGGTLRLFATTIDQSGVLLAPFGSISLGYDGQDLNLSTSQIDIPENRAVRGALPTPIAENVILRSGSITSVAGIDFGSNAPLLVPFGFSFDGSSIIDPRGLDITASGLPEKSIRITGNSITTEAGSFVDIRGGGDLFAYRWLGGTTGPVDFLGEAGIDWAPGFTYATGDLVKYNGRTWSARRTIRPTDFSGLQGPSPEISRYWTLVPEAYAVVPGYNLPYAPYSPFNTGPTAIQQLNNNPGYVGSNLKVGDQIYLDGGSGLDSGTYTLLPRRYALLPGAYLVSPMASDRTLGLEIPSSRGYFVGSSPMGTYTVTEGATVTTGYRSNAFQRPSRISGLRDIFEVVSAETLEGRSDYEVYDLNAFISDAATRLNLESSQRVPGDAGYLLFHGNTALNLGGGVLSTSAAGGRGSLIDISSFADIKLVVQGAGGGGGVVLDSQILSSYGAESLVIGGVRYSTSTGQAISVRTQNILLDNAGSNLQAGDVAMFALRGIELAAGSQIQAGGTASQNAGSYEVAGDGIAVRVSGDPLAGVTRTGVTSSNLPLLTIGDGATLIGSGVTLDSSYGFQLSPTAVISVDQLHLGAGQISLLLDGPTALTGEIVTPQLVLSGNFLAQVQNLAGLDLIAYQSTIDLYGPGAFGSSLLEELSLQTGEVRGFNQGAGDITITAANVSLSNPRGLIAPPPSLAPTSGRLVFNSRIFESGAGTTTISKFGEVVINASGGMRMAEEGSLLIEQDLTANVPVLVAGQGARQSIIAEGNVNFNKSGTATISPSLGGILEIRGDSVTLGSDVLLPSGRLTVRADGPGGNVEIGGLVDVSGVGVNFYDVTKYTDGGEIRLTSDSGDVNLLAQSELSVAANSGGGNAGKIVVNAGQGRFFADGIFDGQKGSGGKGGSFQLDAGSLASLNVLRDLLNSGGFDEVRDVRVRSGNLVVAGTHTARNYSLTADNGSITVSGLVDASGVTGGKISLVAKNNLTLLAGSRLTVAADIFSSAGKGGEVYLEAGASTSGSSGAGVVDIQSLSEIDLSVAAYQQGATSDLNGRFTDPTSSAFLGQFRGTLHIRAPRLGLSDFAVNKIQGTITGASSILAEAYRIYDRTGSSGVMNIALRNQINTDSSAFILGYEAANSTKLLGGTVNAALDPILVVSPGAEIINTTGDLVLGTANTSGSTNVEARTTADWDLSTFRYGAKRAPGVLTMRAAGDIYFNNTLSDGFTPVASGATSGFSTMWLATLQTIDLDGGGNLVRPINLQNWSYNITAGADITGAASRTVTLNTSGSVFVGEFFNSPVPNTTTSGAAPATGDNGLTANSIRISTTGTDLGTRFEVIRTGTGAINISASKDVQLRNQFATIYTAGTRIAQPNNLFGINDFRIPDYPSLAGSNPNQSGLGDRQQFYGPTVTGGTPGVEGVTGPRRIAQYSMAGGQISVTAGEDIGRYQRIGADILQDSSRQLPNNWLYRRGYVDPETGLFGAISPTGFPQINDVSASTTWWIDYSNFFQGIGTLGGGDISLQAAGNIENVDAVAPTNARMSGRDASGNIAPNADLLLELGGGDISIIAGNNIDGGVYYVERGAGILKAGGEIKTNATRSPTFGYLQSSSNPTFSDPLLFLPTTLFAGKGRFDVSAFGDVLLGPVANPFLLPQGINNRFWYKTYFNTMGEDSAVSVSSLQGDVTHRMSVVTTTGDTINPLWNWLLTQNRYPPVGSPNPQPSAIQTAAFYQPWLRLAETDVSEFSLVTSIIPAALKTTAYSGDINLVGSMNLFPSASGQLELLASGAVNGINPAGVLQTGETAYVVGSVNVSDADSSLLSGITSPYSYFVNNRTIADLVVTTGGFLSEYSDAFAESGSYSGAEAGIDRQRPRHTPGILHANSTEPVRVYAGTGDISGLTLFTPKPAQILAGRDITDISFYLQNTGDDSISIVSAGRDIIPFQENSELRTAADSGSNILLATARARTDGTSTTALQGDIQVSGPGALEVLAGRNIDLGSSEPFADGTGSGITSIGRRRNPFLTSEGARLIVLAGIEGKNGGAAAGLRNSSLTFDTFIAEYIEGGVSIPNLTADLQEMLDEFETLSEEQQAITALDLFYAILRQAASEQAETGSYQTGFDAISALFAEGTSGSSSAAPGQYGWEPWDSVGDIFSGDIQTRTRSIRTISGGAVTIAAPGGGLTMAANLPTPSDIPPGIVTDAGGSIDIFLKEDLDIGATRVFTLRGGDLTIWSSGGDIAAGTAAKTVVSAPPTRVSIDATSGEVLADLGGLATGGGIGVLASVSGIEPGSVFLIAPGGTIDAGDAGIRATGDITLAATSVVNADNISAGGTSTGVPSAPTVAAPNLGGLSSASSSTAATSNAATQVADQARPTPTPEDENPSIIEVEVLGYGGGE